MMDETSSSEEPHRGQNRTPQLLLLQPWPCLRSLAEAGVPLSVPQLWQGKRHFKAKTF